MKKLTTNKNEIENFNTWALRHLRELEPKSLRRTHNPYPQPALGLFPLITPVIAVGLITGLTFEEGGPCAKELSHRR